MATKKKISFKLSNDLMTAILYIVIGVLCCVLKTQEIDVMFTVIGSLFVIQGILSVVEKDWVNAGINLVVGVVIIVFAWALTDIILVIFGILIILSGVQQLVPALKQKNIMPVLAAAITIAIGIMLVVAKYVLADWIFIVVGIIFIVNGVLKLLGKK